MAGAGADDRGPVYGGRCCSGFPGRLGGPYLSRLDRRADADLWLLLRRADTTDGAVLLGRQVGAAAAASSRSHEPHAAADLPLLGRPGIHAEEAVSVGAVQRWSFGAEGRVDRRRGACHRVEASDVECERVLGGGLYLLRDLGILCVAAKHAQPGA